MVLAANHFYQGTVSRANQVLDGFGMRFDDEENASATFEVSGDDIARDPLTVGVRTGKFFRASPVTIVEPTAAKILVAAPPHPERGFVTVARSGKAEIVALGASLWWSWISDPKTVDSDNARLLQNILTRNSND